MALKSLFVCGPRRSGKSTVIQQVISHAQRSAEINAGQRPHYIRLSAGEGDKRQPPEASPPEKDCGVASARWVTYEPDRVFEILPDALSRIHRCDRKGVVIIEANADPLLRHAYPYDFRLFVMPTPRRMFDVFRTHDQAADALMAALNDTAVFAGEIFGLIEENGDKFDIDAHEKRSALTKSQMRGLMSSPLGNELATRILLQQSYHGLLESDIVLVNRAVGGTPPVAERVIRQLDHVLAHFRRHSDRSDTMLMYCDPTDPDDPLRGRLIDRLVGALWNSDGHAA